MYRILTFQTMMPPVEVYRTDVSDRNVHYKLGLSVKMHKFGV